MLLVSLYTSRVVLAALGVDDYGIYNVVGGIVTVLGFLNGTLSTASSRYITVALGRGIENDLYTVFSSVFFVNVFLCILILILGETIGLWFLLNKMVIPEGRMNAAFWVYQISILTVIINILSVPYNATIIAHERMNAFAYISLFDAFAKLGIAFLLTYNISFDKLILYAILLFLIQLTDRVVYGQYCLRKFPETRIKWCLDKSLLKEMGTFILWSSYGSLVSVGCTQGLNIILNLFFGTAVNAARAVSVQVQSAIVLFAVNFQTAVNPQLIKSYARGEYAMTRRLLTTSSKLSFLLLCLLGTPVIANANSIMSLWLKDVPEHAVIFVQIMIVIGMLQSLAHPIRIVNQAEGHIKKFQLWECTYLAMIIPLSYFALKIGMQPVSVFFIQLIIEFSAQFIRLFIVLPYVNMTMLDYVRSVYFRIIPVFVLSIVLAFLLKMLANESIWSLFLTCAATVLLSLAIAFVIGLNKSEKKWLLIKVHNFFDK